MIEIVKYKNGFKVTGHAGYADAGKDIVCASVSILAQVGMYMLMDDGVYHVDHKTGYLHIYVDEDAVDGHDAGIRIKTVLDTIDEGFKLMYSNYPEYIIRKEEDIWMK